MTTVEQDSPVVPETMTGIYLPGDSTTERRTVSVPTPGPGQLLVEVGAAGICGTDISYIYREYKTHRGIDGPAYRGVVSGHEPSGRVVAAGPNCARFTAGDRVIVYHIAGCGLCDNCRRGYYISCTADSRESYGWQRDGGNARYVLAEERTCVPLPEELSYVDGALIACGFGTAYEGLRRVGVSGEGDLLVVGLGPVGLAAGMIGRGMGARRVVGVELSEVRRTWADSLGIFDATVSPDEADALLTEMSGGAGFGFTIDASGSAPGRTTAVQHAAEWGHVSFIGEGGRFDTEVSDTLLHKQLTLHASWVTSLQAMSDLAHNLVAWGLRPETVVSDRFSLDQAEEAFALAAGGSRGKVVFVSNSVR
ncbi:zinc-binding dehydrogenase [Rhodococcus sp. ARC_M5]|uniref:zinc-dependent alcohol dehydrogenase family protein n=1 Tax=Rhodococcus sp. ARC_M5 TaxID=2928851 RepID=UPI001FB33ED1|nr:zinc-binding dehydrogenase [Rhodococcus sp. ARC_M5]MCJ0893781.1 zinc-binding dehydrogenase [Rhodococcus sp. ARC_M5]